MLRCLNTHSSIVEAAVQAREEGDGVWWEGWWVEAVEVPKPTLVVPDVGHISHVVECPEHPEFVEVSRSVNLSVAEIVEPCGLLLR